MDNRAGNRSSKKNKQNAIVHEKQDVKTNAEVDGDKPLCGITDSDKKSTDREDLSEYIYVDAKKLRKILGCPLCKGILRKTKAFKTCIHYFCGECIDEKLKHGKKQCPICLTTCRSRNATVEDHHFDNIVSIFFPKIEDNESQASKDYREKNVARDDLDENMKLMEDKSVQYQGKRPVGEKISPCSSKKESVPTPSDATLLSDEMLDRVAKRVATAIVKHKAKLAQQASSTDRKE